MFVCGEDDGTNYFWIIWADCDWIISNQKIKIRFVSCTELFCLLIDDCDCIIFIIAHNIVFNTTTVKCCCVFLIWDFKIIERIILVENIFCSMFRLGNELSYLAVQIVWLVYMKSVYYYFYNEQIIPPRVLIVNNRKKTVWIQLLLNKVYLGLRFLVVHLE